MPQLVASPKPSRHFAVVTSLIETFGFSPLLASTVVVFLAALAVLAVVWVMRSAPPRTLVLASGPAGSSFQRWAVEYQKALAAHGVTLQDQPSAGSLDNLKRLQAASSPADIGFVAGGATGGQKLVGLVSLGSIAYQPLMIFYRSAAPIPRLAELAGKQVAVGAAGSATRALALQLLSANGITGAPTVFSNLDAEAAATALLDGKLDAVFLMGDSASTQTLRSLVRAPEVQLFDFNQADAYVRRYPYLSKLELPEGSFDLGKNLPSQDIELVGTTVELVARADLNPALSDLLLEVAQEVHGRAGLFQKRGEFPAAQEHDFPLSEDALRYYKSGKGFFYRTIPSFWLASLASRLLVVVVPLALILIPALRMLPVVYRMSIRLRILRCYRPLLRMERDLAGPLDPGQIKELHQRLDEIGESVDHLKVPASFADQFYDLRTHIVFVRQRLVAAEKK